MTNNKEIKITEEDLRYIYGEDYKIFQTKILPNCFCRKCKGNDHVSTIINYEIFINDLSDVVLRGHCIKCNNKIGRCSETGDVEKYLKRVKGIREKYKKAQTKNVGNSDKFSIET